MRVQAKAVKLSYLNSAAYLMQDPLFAHRHKAATLSTLNFAAHLKHVRNKLVKNIRYLAQGCVRAVPAVTVKSEQNVPCA